MIRDYEGNVTYRGAVLCAREENWANDSDFYAVVWDEVEQKCKRDDYATTRFGGSGWATVDATLEVIEKANAWLTNWMIGRITQELEEKSRLVEVGRIVIVVKGRKYQHGRGGEVLRLYGGRWGISALVRWADTLDEGWIAVANLEIAEPEQYMSDEEVVLRLAGNATANGMYYLPFSHCRVIW